MLLIARTLQTHVGPPQKHAHPNRYPHTNATHMPAATADAFAGAPLTGMEMAQPLVSGTGWSRDTKKDLREWTLEQVAENSANNFLRPGGWLRVEDRVGAATAACHAFAATARSRCNFPLPAQAPGGAGPGPRVPSGGGALAVPGGTGA